MYVVFKVRVRFGFFRTKLYFVRNGYQQGLIRRATVAQLVEYDLAKVGVAGSSPVCRLVENSGKPYKSRLPVIFILNNFEDS